MPYPTLVKRIVSHSIMSELARPEDEELVDYDDTEETFAQPTTEATNGAKADGDKKGSYVGIHSTGFRWVVHRSDAEDHANR
jgi:hypothetical protein